jgi:Na+/proline symporter
MYIQSSAVISYAVILLAIGIFLLKLARHGKEGFLLAGRNLRSPLDRLHYLSSFVLPKIHRDDKCAPLVE